MGCDAVGTTGRAPVPEADWAPDRDVGCAPDPCADCDPGRDMGCDPDPDPDRVTGCAPVPAANGDPVAAAGACEPLSHGFSGLLSQAVGRGPVSHGARDSGAGVS